MVFRGRENALKFCTTQKRTEVTWAFLFTNKVQAPYRENYIKQQGSLLEVTQKCKTLVKLCDLLHGLETIF